MSKCAFAITASRSGFGMPLPFVLPSAASANIVSNRAARTAARAAPRRRSAPRRRPRSRTCERCPPERSHDLPALLVCSSRPRRKPTVPRRTSKRSSWEGVHVGCGYEAVRLHVTLDDDGLAVRLTRGRAEDDALAGDGILDDVPWDGSSDAPFRSDDDPAIGERAYGSTYELLQRGRVRAGDRERHRATSSGSSARSRCGSHRRRRSTVGAPRQRAVLASPGP